jgi:hypothetical protein
MDTANRRIQKTWDMLGPVEQMTDRIGHKYEEILLRQLNEVANIKIFELTEHQAAKFNNMQNASNNN